MSRHLCSTMGEKPSSAECVNEEKELGVLAERDSRLNTKKPCNKLNVPFACLMSH